MNGLLPSWWLALLEEARLGLAHGQGPFWSGRFLCGQPLFGAPELPYGGPGGALLTAWGPVVWLAFHALVFSCGLAAWLGQREKPPARRAVAGIVALACAGFVLFPESAALLGAWAWVPWAALLGAGEAWLPAAPFCALVWAGASPLAALVALAGSGFAARSKGRWLLAWGLGALLAAPVLLELLRLAPQAQAAAVPGWPLAFLGSPLAFFLALAVFLAALWPGGSRGRGRRYGLVFGLAAGVWALGAPLFIFRSAPAPDPGAYVRNAARRLTALGRFPVDLAGLLSERWVGAAGGLVPARSLERWKSMSSLGLAYGDGLTLANVGWVDGGTGQAGGPWFKPAAAAFVEGAESENVPVREGATIFDRPLRLASGSVPKADGWAWFMETPSEPDPGCAKMGLPPSHGEGWAFLSRSLDPGWSALALAKGRGEERRVWETEDGFMAVRVEAGDDSIEFRYGPPTALPGLGLAIFGFALFAWLAAASLLPPLRRPRA